MKPTSSPLLAILLAGLLALCTILAPARAGAFDEDADWHSQREAAAESSFQTIMQSNAVDGSGAMAGEAAAPASVAAPRPMDEPSPTGTEAPATVTVPLARWEAARQALARARELAGEQPPPLVVLGASSYEGQDIGGALRLRLDLQVTLHGEDLWKTVPLVGEEVVVVAAQADGRAVPLSTHSGYHVWVTRQVGEVTLSLDLLVPSRGRRGSLEYEFLVARTPVTRFQSDFPSPGLQPRLRGAVQAETSTVDQGRGTRLVALLAPTSRIHLVGYKDQGQDEGRQARVYAESMNLLSIDEGGQDLFTVVRYNILHAGQKEFDIALPAGYSLVSADGEGAFRYTVDGADETGSAVLRGETEFPIRNGYEISLRLRRDGAQSGEPFTLALPRCLGVEREYGWLAVEVTGTLRLEELSRDGAAMAVDVRQLPWEMVQSAVSPILAAWRTHSAEATVQLRATRLPDVEPQSASVDRVEADTVVSAEGRRLTDVRITLRNRLRHSLRVVLPAGAVVRSSLLDGEPVKPSKAADGALLFPLKRSEEEGAGLRPFTVQLVVEEEGAPLRLLGRQALALPAVELPVSSLSWTVWLPAAHRYSALESDVEPQQAAGAGQWFQPPQAGGFFQPQAAEGTEDATLAAVEGSAETGAMPVRIELPKAGTALSLSRYWVEGGVPVTARTWHARSWLSAPVALCSFAGLFVLLGRVGRRQLEAPLHGRVLAVHGLGLLLLGALLAATGGVGLVLLAALAAGLRLAGARGLHRRLLPGLRAWGRGQGPQPGGFRQRGILSRLGLVGAGLATGMVLFVALVRWLSLVGSPL